MAWKPNAISYVHKSEESFFFVPFVEYACIYKLFSACSFGFHFLGSEIPSNFTTSWSSCQRSARHTSFCRSIGPFFFFYISETAEKNNFISSFT